MTILHLTTFLQGGAGLVIATLARSQRAAGHRVVVVTSANGRAWLRQLRRPSRHAARRGRRAPSRRLVVHARSRRHAPRRLVRPETLRSPYVVDVVHTHAATPSLAALILAGRAPSRVPIVQTMHGWGVSKSASQARTDVAIMNLVDRVVVPANVSAALLEELGVAAERVRVIPYGVAPREDRTERTGRGRGRDAAAAQAMAAGSRAAQARSASGRISG